MGVLHYAQAGVLLGDHVDQTISYMYRMSMGVLLYEHISDV
jgi:hypothetical protein